MPPLTGLIISRILCYPWDLKCRRIMISSLKNNEDGYTIIEMLVALSLMSVLLYFSSGILGNLALNNQIGLKTQAIQEARNQLEKTLVFKDYREFEKTIDKKLVLKQIIERKEGLIKIEVEVYLKKNEQMIYRLQAYDKE